MVVSREIRRLIQTGARAEALQATAMKEGMRTLRQDGIEKVLAGQHDDRGSAGDQQRLTRSRRQRRHRTPRGVTTGSLPPRFAPLPPRGRGRPRWGRFLISA